MRKLIKILANYISNKNGYTKDQEELIEYALRITVFENIKLVGIIIICSFLGYPVQAVIAVGTMALVKPFIGGYHEDTQIKCFTASILIVGSIIYLSTNINIDIVSKIILSFVSIYCIWNQAPVVHPKMALTKPELINRNRYVGLSITIVLILISIIFIKYKTVSDSILWTIVFQTLLLFNKKSFEKPVNIQC